LITFLVHPDDVDSLKTTLAALGISTNGLERPAAASPLFAMPYGRDLQFVDEDGRPVEFLGTMGDELRAD
jgi:hypothetical protein